VVFLYKEDLHSFIKEIILCDVILGGIALWVVIIFVEFFLF
jgi:hypothetical protein